jgi:hypothetical protein
MICSEISSLSFVSESDPGNKGIGAGFQKTGIKAFQRQPQIKETNKKIRSLYFTTAKQILQRDYAIILTCYCGYSVYF